MGTIWLKQQVGSGAGMVVDFSPAAY